VTQKIIYFSNSDLAFYIDEITKRTQIYNLSDRTLELSFTASTPETLTTVQSLLRKKMCELGFYKKYKIIKRLGHGATANVDLVQRVADKKLFAAKVISIKNSS
jgi:serine/threonine protein kinase